MPRRRASQKAQNKRPALQTKSCEEGFVLVTRKDFRCSISLLVVRVDEFEEPKDVQDVAFVVRREAQSFQRVGVYDGREIFGSGLSSSPNFREPERTGACQPWCRV